MRITHRSGQKNAAWPSSTDYPGVLNAIVSPGPWRRLEPGGRHDVNVRTRRQMLVRRSGYGAMQLAGSYAFGPPPDRASAIGVRKDAVAAGVDHIDTAQYYGPGVVNDLIREALPPTPTAWPSSGRSRSGETMTVPSSRSTIRTSCARTSKTNGAPVAQSPGSGDASSPAWRQAW